MEAECRARHLQHVVLDRDHHRHVRGHPRSQLELAVLRADHGGVGHNSGLDDGLQPHLGDAPLELGVGIGVHREGDGQAGANAADVGLVDLRLDLHLGEVVRDHEELGRLEAGRDRLPDVDRARDHNAVDRSADRGVGEIHCRGLELSPRLLEVGRSLIHLDLGGFHVGLGYVVALDQLVRSLELPLRTGVLATDQVSPPSVE